MPIHDHSMPLRGGLLASTILLVAVGTGCETPYQRHAEADLRRSVAAAVEREIASLPPDQQVRTTEAATVDLSGELDTRVEELDRVGPQQSSGGATLDLGLGLDGTVLEPVTLSLEEAIQTAVVQNLGIQNTRIDQSIASAEVVQAEAAFDAVLGAGTNFASIDEPASDLVLSDGLGDDQVFFQGTDASQWGFSTDLNKRLTTGGAIEVSYAAERQSSRGPGAQARLDPNPSTLSTVGLGLAQPLLRGFGEDVNTASIKLARNSDRRAALAIEAELLDLVVEVEQAYWRLYIARQELVVANWLVGEGERIRDILGNRRGFDTTLAQYADAVATVESRKTRLIRARRDVGQAMDLLKLLVNAPDLPIGAEVDVVPVDSMVEAPYTFDLRDSIATALGQSPVIDAAIIGIDDASIAEIVARNGRLPVLDLKAEVSWLGLADGLGGSLQNVDGNFVDYLVGLQFSQPIGNRAPESVLQQARLRRSAAVIRYRQAIQQTVLEVKNAIRDIEAGYALVGQARNFRLAQAENLRALEALRETLAALTPEFLNLLFQRQERLGEAQLQELNSLIAYNLAIAELHRVTGTGLEANRIDLVVTDGEGAGQ